MVFIPRKIVSHHADLREAAADFPEDFEPENIPYEYHEAQRYARMIQRGRKDGFAEHDPILRGVPKLATVSGAKELAAIRDMTDSAQKRERTKELDRYSRGEHALNTVRWFYGIDPEEGAGAGAKGGARRKRRTRRSKAKRHGSKRRKSTRRRKRHPPQSAERKLQIVSVIGVSDYDRRVRPPRRVRLPPFLDDLEAVARGVFVRALGCRLVSQACLSTGFVWARGWWVTPGFTGAGAPR